MESVWKKRNVPPVAYTQVSGAIWSQSSRSKLNFHPCLCVCKRACMCVTKKIWLVFQSVFLINIFTQSSSMAVKPYHVMIPQHSTLFIINILIPSIHLQPLAIYLSIYTSLYSIYCISADTTPAPPSPQCSQRTETKRPRWPCSHSQDD